MDLHCGKWAGDTEEHTIADSFHHYLLMARGEACTAPAIKAFLDIITSGLFLRL